MDQSNAIFGALVIAYIVFITARGELQTYIQILRGGGKIALQQSSSNPSGTPLGGSIGGGSGGGSAGVSDTTYAADNAQYADDLALIGG